MAARSRSAGFDVFRQADAVRHRIGVTGQVSAVDSQFTGEENLRLMADLLHVGRVEGRRRVPSFSFASTRRTRPGSPPPPTPAACVAGSTSR